MEEAIIRKYAGLMRELGLSKLEVSENGGSVRMEFGCGTQKNAPAPKAELPEKAETASGLYEFRSPMVGVFYGAAAETEAPFVKVGDLVHKGDVLCIIEAMKLMNEIVAERDGIVAELCAENKQVVEFGQTLFRFGEVTA